MTAGDSLHEVGDGSLVGAYFLRGLGEAAAPLLPAIASPAARVSATRASVPFRANADCLKRTNARRHFLFSVCIS